MKKYQMPSVEVNNVSTMQILMGSDSQIGPEVHPMAPSHSA